MAVPAEGIRIGGDKSERTAGITMADGICMAEVTIHIGGAVTGLVIGSAASAMAYRCPLCEAHLSTGAVIVDKIINVTAITMTGLAVSGSFEAFRMFMTFRTPLCGVVRIDSLSLHVTLIP